MDGMGRPKNPRRDDEGLRRAMLVRPKLVPAKVKLELEALRDETGRPVWPIMDLANYQRVRQQLVGEGRLDKIVGRPKGSFKNKEFRQAVLDRPMLTVNEIKEDMESPQPSTGKPAWPVKSLSYYGEIRKELEAQGKLPAIAEVRKLRKHPDNNLSVDPRYKPGSWLGRWLPEVYVPIKSEDATILRTLFKHKGLTVQELQKELDKAGVAISTAKLYKILRSLVRAKEFKKPPHGNASK